ncbi:MAG: hypothetical protein ACLUHC_05810 [Clostridia bacterium]
MARNKTKTNKDRKYEPIYRDIETSFRDFFGTKVKLDAEKRKGKIIIEYSNNDDLERILELIKNKERKYMENIVNTLNNSYVILGTVVVNIILLILYISSNVKLRRLNKEYRNFMKKIGKEKILTKT